MAIEGTPKKVKYGSYMTDLEELGYSRAMELIVNG